jgi:hypothetical protein
MWPKDCVGILYKLKGEVVPLHPTKACRGSGCLVASILNLGTRWRLVVKFMPWPLCPHGKNPQYPLFVCGRVDPRTVGWNVLAEHVDV